MKIERHDVAARMSKVVVHGDTVYLAGIVANDPKSKSTAEQTKDILSQIDGFLKRPAPTSRSCCRPISGSPIWRPSAR